MSVENKRNLVDPFAYIKTAAAITIFIVHLKVFSNMQGYVITGANWYMKTAAHGAVWVFFFLSGYFNISGFLGTEPKYRLDPHGILKFYAGRFFKVLLPVWCFYLIALVISEPAFIHLYPKVILRLLTFTYTGEPGCTSIAATWYVSTLAWMYVFTPLIAWICRWLEKRQGSIHLVLFSAVAASLGFAERMIFLWRGT
ncbi:MAG: acyltransferase family protein, partial [Lachnospiraceae bacterium]|nr:acyltransferase family protein [Lachnospiraceae bacterium]